MLTTRVVHVQAAPRTPSSTSSVRTKASPARSLTPAAQRLAAKRLIEGVGWDIAPARLMPPSPSALAGMQQWEAIFPDFRRQLEQHPELLRTCHSEMLRNWHLCLEPRWRGSGVEHTTPLATFERAPHDRCMLVDVDYVARTTHLALTARRRGEPGYLMLQLGTNAGGRCQFVSMAHIVAHLRWPGSKQPGDQVLHRRCVDVSLCVNPQHLAFGSALDNARDRWLPVWEGSGGEAAARARRRSRPAKPPPEVARSAAAARRASLRSHDTGGDKPSQPPPPPPPSGEARPTAAAAAATSTSSSCSTSSCCQAAATSRAAKLTPLLSAVSEALRRVHAAEQAESDV